LHGIPVKFVKLRTFNEEESSKGERDSLSYSFSDYFHGFAGVGRG
jgi:hypothetical protein